MLKPFTVWITTNWKILQEMRIPDHLTCLLRHLYAGQEATVRTRHGTMALFKNGKGVCQDCILLPCLFNLCMRSISYRILGWMNHKLESRLLGEISATSDVWKVKRFKEAPWGWWKRRMKKLTKAQQSKNDHGIQSHHFMTTNRWGNNGNSDRLYILGLQIHCRWWPQSWN